MSSHLLDKDLPSQAADVLRFAAAPVFGLLAFTSGGAAPDMLCMHAASSWGGMGLMYGLMAAFHLAPWLRLASRPR
ncbi:hypothetical protein [Dongia sp.]|uniref:hypothetical protein n=1 Tax=Dongia sp. TaxID=1977262 RepID=UPI00375308C5